MNGSRQKSLILNLVISVFLLSGALSGISQQQVQKTQEISDSDGRPVLLQHLPDHEKVESSAVFTADKNALKAVVENRPIIEVLDFPYGTEAVIASYPQGKLVVVEYTNPQSSIEADGKIQQYIGGHPEGAPVYRRIGNYNAFVFDAPDPAAAGALLDQVKYEKTVQWLGEDPYILKKLERYMVTTSKDIMISTVLVIVFGLAASILAGIAAGFIFYRVRDQKRAVRTAYSDAGGLTRLNLDGLSE